VGHEEEVGVMTLGNCSRMGRISEGTEEREEIVWVDGEEEGSGMGVGGTGRGGAGVGGAEMGGKETWQVLELIMASFALRKSKPKMGCVTFA
jgi:hypothetical protein